MGLSAQEWTRISVSVPRLGNFSVIMSSDMFSGPFSLSSPVFPTYRSSFSICCRAGLVVLNSLSFCLSVKLLISPSNLNEILAGRVILVVGSSLSSL